MTPACQPQPPPRHGLRWSLAPLALLLCFALAELALCSAQPSALSPTPNSVRIDGYVLRVAGSPFRVRGVAYSPTPIGENVHFPPHGDYFTADYVYLWARDFPALKAMGVNTLRIYAWALDTDHGAFMDAAHAAGLKVIPTHYVGTALETPIRSPAERQAVIDTFVRQVALIGDHPALLAWSFGNELNGPWNGFIPSLNTEFGCGWTQSCLESVNVTSPCHAAQGCLYTHLLGWLDSALEQAGAVTTRPLTSTFADVGQIAGTHPEADKIPRFASSLSHFDFFAMQLYRGRTFGDYFTQYGAETSKPLLIAEYGVDAMNDPCGWSENFYTMRPCYNHNSGAPGTLGGSVATPDFRGCENPAQGAADSCNFPGETNQLTWDLDLTTEILAATSTLGGILMEWHDEYWKNIGTEDKCQEPCPINDIDACTDPNNTRYMDFALNTGSAACTYKAHVSCSNWNASHHDLCGYYLWSAPDQYVNEAWFGLMALSDCGTTFSDGNNGHRLSVLQPREVVAALQTKFGGSGSTAPVMSTSCLALRPCWECAQQQQAAGVAAGLCNVQCGMTFAGGVGLDVSSSSSGGSSSSSSGIGSSSSSSSGISSSSSSSSSGFHVGSSTGNADVDDPWSSSGGGLSTTGRNASSGGAQAGWTTTISSALCCLLLAAQQWAAAH